MTTFAALRTLPTGCTRGLLSDVDRVNFAHHWIFIIIFFIQAESLVLRFTGSFPLAANY